MQMPASCHFEDTVCIAYYTYTTLSTKAMLVFVNKNDKEFDPAGLHLDHTYTRQCCEDKGHLLGAHNF
jgi:hypothetical protein